MDAVALGIRRQTVCQPRIALIIHVYVLKDKTNGEEDQASSCLLNGTPRLLVGRGEKKWRYIK